MGEASGAAAEAMITTAVRHSLLATVREIRQFFADEHVHAALIVGPAGYLAAVVERNDLIPDCAEDAAAARLGHLAGRVVPAWADLAEVRETMTANGRRRMAVVDPAGRLLGLLCLKASQTGFCSDEDVRSRRAASRLGIVQSVDGLSREAASARREPGARLPAPPRSLRDH
jgi:hypothetical protein